MFTRRPGKCSKSYLPVLGKVFRNFSPSRCDTVHKFDLLFKDGVPARAKDFWKEGLDKGTHGERLARRGREA